jgi:DNA polymerase-3 subunit alpha
MYSIRDAIVRIDELAVKCNELGIESCAITDHGICSAAYKQWKIFKEHKVKPLIGCEFYFTDNALEKNQHYHLVVIAKNMDGYRNICELSRYSYQDGFYRKPRIDRGVLDRCAGNVIVTTACVFGLPQQLILNEQYGLAMDEIRSFKKTFGEDFYLEIADHGLEDEDVVRDAFRNIGRDLDIKCLPATDTHYLNKGDKELHNIFKQLAYNTVGKGDDGFDGKNYHVWSLEEMQECFTKEEIENTNEVADKCNISFDFTGYNLPAAEIEGTNDAYEELLSLANAGLKEKGLDKNPIYVDRVNFEIGQLHLSDLEDYFLIVRDYVDWAKKHNIPVGPGRGSAAGSLISYLIGVTGVDPIKYDLLFSRCVNNGRALQYDFGE